MTQTITFKDETEFKDYVVKHFGGLADVSFDKWTARELAITFIVEDLKIAVRSTIHSEVFGSYTYNERELKDFVENVKAFKRLFNKMATILKSDYKLTFDKIGSAFKSGVYTLIEYDAVNLTHPNLTQPFTVINDDAKNIKVGILSKNEFEVYSTKTYKI